MELCVVQILSLEQSIFTNIDQITQTVHYSNACGRLGGVVLVVCTCNGVVNYLE